MPRVSEVAKKGIQYEKRTTVDADLKSSLTNKSSSAAPSSSSGSHHHKKKEKDLKSAELTQWKEDSVVVTVNKTASSSSPSGIDKVGM